MKPTITVQLDADKAKVGSVTATWEDEGEVVFSFSRRLDGDAEKEGVKEFVADAQAAYKEWVSRTAREARIAERIEALFPDKEVAP